MSEDFGVSKPRSIGYCQVVVCRVRVERRNHQVSRSHIYLIPGWVEFVLGRAQVPRIESATRCVESSHVPRNQTHQTGGNAQPNGQLCLQNIVNGLFLEDRWIGQRGRLHIAIEFEGRDLNRHSPLNCPIQLSNP